MTTTRVMMNTVAVLFVLAVSWLLIQIRPIIIILILAIILAAAIEPFVSRLRRMGLARGQSIMVVYAVILAALGLTLYLVVPPVARQVIELVNGIPDIVASLRDQAAASNNQFLSTTGVRSLDRVAVAYEQFRESPNVESSTALNVVTSVFGLIFTTFSVMIVAFYWMTEKAIIKRLTLGFVPLNRRASAHAMWDEIEAKLGGWTRGQFILCTSIGIFSAIGYRIIGLEFWLALGIWAGITEIIPFVGPILGGGAAVIVALTDSWEKAVAVVIFALVLQQLEGAVLVPRVMRNAVGMTPLTVILAVLVGGLVLGPIGAVLAIPVAAALQVLVQSLLQTRAEDPDVPYSGTLPPIPSAPVTHIQTIEPEPMSRQE
ncbi:MAG: AI-2E family transporter [Chloroflexia bacterium]|nr:AI-2E family transporter [Chloroflexia bacterium]